MIYISLSILSFYDASSTHLAMCHYTSGGMLSYQKWIIPLNGNSPEVIPEVNLSISPKIVTSLLHIIKDLLLKR